MGSILTALRRSTNPIVLAGLILAAITGCALIIYSTQPGPWAFSDSTTYLWAARNLANGLGLVMQNARGEYHPLIWHPPLFSILLSLPIKLGIDALQAARWMNAVFFGITIFVGGLATWRFTRSFLAVVSVTALSVFAIDLLFVFSGAMSEATFFALGFSAIFLMVESIQFKPKPFLLGVVGILAGLSFLARYAGIVFSGTIIVIVFLFAGGTFWQRVRTTLPAALPALLIPAAWTVYVFGINRTFGGRNFLPTDSLRIDFVDYFNPFWHVITGWIPYILRGNHILPAAWKFTLGSLVVFLVLAIGLWALKKRGFNREDRPHLLWAATLFLFFTAYLAFHFTSYIFSSAAPEIDRRLLSPLLFSAIFLLGAIFSLPGTATQKTFRPAEWLLFGYMLISLFYFHGRLQDFLYEQHHFGLGYTSKRWKQSELIQRAAHLDPKVTLAANNYALLLFYTGRFPFAIDLPSAADGQLELPGDSAYLVLFRDYSQFRFGEDGDGYLKQLSTICEILYEDSEGYICHWRK